MNNDRGQVLFGAASRKAAGHCSSPRPGPASPPPPAARRGKCDVADNGTENETAAGDFLVVEKSGIAAGIDDGTWGGVASLALPYP